MAKLADDGIGLCRHGRKRGGGFRSSIGPEPIHSLRASHSSRPEKSIAIERLVYRSFLDENSPDSVESSQALDVARRRYCGSLHRTGAEAIRPLRHSLLKKTLWRRVHWPRRSICRGSPRCAWERTFESVEREAGLDMVFETMGSNYGDFDNDGFLDMYLGTGEPSIATLVPNRMFKNVGGKRFSEITASSRTGHLQNGPGVACGDWDRDGDVDLFVETGGAVNGDKYHNLLFQNPGQGNHWLTVKLIGKKTNRAAPARASKW